MLARVGCGRQTHVTRDHSFDTNKGKKYLPRRYGAVGGRAGWHWIGWGDARPLYRLPEIVARPDAPILVVEGEKTADAAQTLLPEFSVTTSMNGSNSPEKTDWDACAGRSVVIWRDNDAEGLNYARALAHKSHRRRCIGALIGSKLLRHNDLAQARGTPRCQHSVTPNTSSLHRSKDARWWPRSQVGRSRPMPGLCCSEPQIAPSAWLSASRPASRMPATQA